MNEAQKFIDNLQAYQQGLADMQAYYEGLIAEGKLANPKEILERFAEELRYELDGESVSIKWTL
jgi:hypothetical protein